MKRLFSVAAALHVPLMAASALGLVACDPPITQTTTVRNDLGAEVMNLEVRFRGEQDEDVEATSGGSFTSLGAIPAGQDVGISALDCGIYDVRATGVGGTCEFIVEGDPADFRYQGEAFYICFAEGRWDLSVHLSSGNCPEVIPPEEG